MISSDYKTMFRLYSYNVQFICTLYNNITEVVAFKSFQFIIWYVQKYDEAPLVILLSWK